MNSFRLRWVIKMRYTREFVHNLLNAIIDNYVTVEQVILWLKPPFDPRNQDLQTWQEIRASWFEDNLVYRGCKVTEPEWVERTVRERTIVLNEEQASALYGGSAVKIASYFVHYRDRLDRTHSHCEQPTERPTQTARELGNIKGRITREAKRNARQAYKSLTQSSPPPTREAIALFAQSYHADHTASPIRKHDWRSLRGLPVASQFVI